MATLSSLTSLRTHLGMPESETSEDIFLTQILAQAEALVRKYVRQTWAVPSASYTQYLNGRNSDTIVLKHKPVVSITSVYLDPSGFWGTGDSAFAAATLLTAGTDYALEPDQSDGGSYSGILRRINGVWPPAVQFTRGNLYSAMVDSKGPVKVTYVAGFATGAVPADITLAVNLVSANLRLFRLGAPMSGSSYDGFSVNLVRGKYSMNPLEPAMSILSPYKSLAMGIN